MGIGNSKGGAKDKKGTEKAKKPAHKYANVYEVSGDSLKRKNKTCPKCGDGFFLAAHKGRATCGKCQYMEAVAAKN